MRWYIAGVANALGVDYGFLAPLPGNKLGTSTQAETQERQSRGKSSRLFMEALTYKFNWAGILPKTTTFKFTASDPEEESERDRAFARRARGRATGRLRYRIRAAARRQNTPHCNAPDNNGNVVDHVVSLCAPLRAVP